MKHNAENRVIEIITLRAISVALVSDMPAVIELTGGRRGSGLIMYASAVAASVAMRPIMRAERKRVVNMSAGTLEV